MRTPTTTLLWMPCVAIMLVACGGKPEYPACEGDDDCKGQICIDKRCVECATDTQCVKKYGAGATCQANRCSVPPKAECVGDGDCKDGGKCRDQKCAPANSCKADVDCGDGKECFGGLCREKTASTNNVSSQCRDVNNPGKIALQTVRFDYDKADIRPEAKAILDQNAECLKQAPEQNVVVEGHCDDRGTTEYNLSLGEQRASGVVKYLDRLGANGKRLRVVSKGKNAPVCSQATEDCYAQNRRVEFK